MTCTRKEIKACYADRVLIVCIIAWVLLGLGLLGEVEVPMMPDRDMVIPSPWRVNPEARSETWRGETITHEE